MRAWARARSVASVSRMPAACSEALALPDSASHHRKSLLTLDFPGRIMALSLFRIKGGAP
ncbi:hypothetical protein [Sphingosinicella sp.]|jgi:hypothetical protein|uniref:hypothetical protein n=1 Tax=Sphingosinicella sp. TaxID=1917971 RepID=UPI00344B1256